MPLKHDTETFLLGVLALVIILTGFVIALLPPLSTSFVPWLVAFVLSLVYPIALYPFLRSRRADYPFRALHFVPAIMLVLWLVLQLLVEQWPRASVVPSLFAWGWTLPVVIPALFLLAAFALYVIRERVARLVILAGLLFAFLVFAVLGERWQWDRQVAAVLWPKIGITDTGTTVVAARSSSSSSRASQIAVVASASLSQPQSKPRISSKAQWGSSSSKAPPQLSHAGPTAEFAGLFAVAAYCGVVHNRARRRMRA